MENLPKNVINKIMLYLSHPTADIVEESSIYKYMQHRFEKMEGHSNSIYYGGSPFHCGEMDACHPPTGRRGPVWDPRKCDVYESGRIINHRRLEEEELFEYEIAWLHSAAPYRVRRHPDVVVFWKIKPREIHGNRNEILELESGTEYSLSDRTETTSDSD